MSESFREKNSFSHLFIFLFVFSPEWETVSLEEQRRLDRVSREDGEFWWVKSWSDFTSCSDLLQTWPEASLMIKCSTRPIRLCPSGCRSQTSGRTLRWWRCATWPSVWASRTPACCRGAPWCIMGAGFPASQPEELLTTVRRRLMEWAVLSGAWTRLLLLEWGWRSSLLERSERCVGLTQVLTCLSAELGSRTTIWSLRPEQSCHCVET